MSADERGRSWAWVMLLSPGQRLGRWCGAEGFWLLRKANGVSEVLAGFVCRKRRESKRTNGWTADRKDTCIRVVQRTLRTSSKRRCIFSNTFRRPHSLWRVFSITRNRLRYGWIYWAGYFASTSFNPPFFSPSNLHLTFFRKVPYKKVSIEQSTMRTSQSQSRIPLPLLPSTVPARTGRQLVSLRPHEVSRPPDSGHANG